MSIKFFNDKIFTEIICLKNNSKFISLNYICLVRSVILSLIIYLGSSFRILINQLSTNLFIVQFFSNLDLVTNFDFYLSKNKLLTKIPNTIELQQKLRTIFV